MADIKAQYEAIFNRITSEIRSAVEDTLREGAEEARNNVATRGTAHSGKAGRIETGAMINSIDYEITSSSENLVEGRFGFNGQPAYTVFQEGGFIHNFSGRAVEGRYATTDAASNAEEKFRARIGRIR